MRISRLLAAAVVVLGLAGCTYEPPDGPLVDYPADRPLLHQQAVDELARWDAAAGAVEGPLFLPLNGGMRQIGDWEPSVVPSKDDLDRLALRADGYLPAAPAANASVRWNDGVAVPLPMVSAADALASIPWPTRCEPACIELAVGQAELIAGVVETTRGSASVPLWQFHIEGSAVLITVPAVTGPKVTLTRQPWDSNGMRFDSAEGSVSGRTLKIHFVGARAGAETRCGADYPTEAVETPRAIVVIIYERAHTSIEPCTMVGYARTATVNLTYPLGERTVLQVQSGAPVPTTRRP